MTRPRVLILRAPGTNCDLETARAFELAGGVPVRMHINALRSQPQQLAQFQIFCIPGGFSYGDDLGAGRILAMQLRHFLRDALARFHERGNLILGICNGFQVLLQTDLLIPDPVPQRKATLTWNDSGRFEDRWVYLQCDGSRCVFLRGLQRMYLPVAHAEGKFVAEKEMLERLRGQGQLVLRYVQPDRPDSEQPVPFPWNPNGSMGNVAGLCDRTGRVLGMMPHPERHILRIHHPRWTRGEGEDPGDGLAVFRNAIAYFQ